ncbi:hypothetical protein A3765_10555 [Oleiphilus sp. HI0130]|nr:hypothetical protein A3765_18580 [Oleiphilus sp. HI0130]KZZ75255.1 hypothetical protein A3765_10555 [Oleiphilus sp. HI0130]
MKSDTLISKVKAALVAVFLCLGFVFAAVAITACSTFELARDYVSDNPLIASIATRQAVAQYIASGHSIEDEISRAEQVQKRITKVLLFVDENASATVDDLMQVINSSIEWEQLTHQDRLLVQDIVVLVESELQKASEPTLSEPTRIVIVAMLRTALSAAQLYASQ